MSMKKKMAPPVCPACGKKNTWRLIGQSKGGYSLAVGLIVGVLLAVVASLIFVEFVVVVSFFVGLLFGFVGKKKYTYYCTNCGLKNDYREDFPEHMRAKIPDDPSSDQPVHRVELVQPVEVPQVEQKKSGCLSTLAYGFFILFIISALLSTCSGGSTSSSEYLDTLSDNASSYQDYYYG